MVHYKLTYFDVRARAEPARLILAYSGVAWEEERMTGVEWPSRKECKIEKSKICDRYYLIVEM